MPLVSVTQRGADGLPILDQGEEIRQSWSGSVRLYMGNLSQEDTSRYFPPFASSSFAYMMPTNKFSGVGEGEGLGSLFVTNRHVIWLSAQNLSKGYQLDFPYVTMHAVCRDSQLF